jgi:hypothetical protein
MPVLEAPFITIIRDCGYCGGAGCQGIKETNDNRLWLYHTEEIATSSELLGSLLLMHQTR